MINRLVIESGVDALAGIGLIYALWMTILFKTKEVHKSVWLAFLMFSIFYYSYHLFREIV